MDEPYKPRHAKPVTESERRLELAELLAPEIAKLVRDFPLPPRSEAT